MLTRTAVVTCLLLFGGAAMAQSNLGDLLDKGAKKLGKEDYLAMMPFKVKYVWPNRGGEGDLVFNADGTLSGTEFHYPSRSESPAVGTWTVDDGGKWCIKKSMAVWNSKTDQCWYSFRQGDDYWGTFSDTDRAARLVQTKITR
jgi:hypothetical protein